MSTAKMENGKWTMGGLHFPLSILHSPVLKLHHFHRLQHRIRALFQGRLLVRGQLHFDDILETPASELARNAQEQAFHSIFALEPRRAWQDALLVVRDRLRYLHRAR